MPPKFSRELKEKAIIPDRLDYQLRTSPCESNCPAGNPIRKVNFLIRENRLEEALEYLISRNPFPGITGRVCTHPCEQSCNRNVYDEGVSIKALERFVADRADLTLIKRPKRKEGSGKKLAIIGSGPAGMTCAYFSAMLGHEVTVFESSALLGGMPRMGIPGFRLPKDVVDLEIGRILELGVKAKTNTTVGKDIAFDEIVEDFNACLIAVGTWKEECPDVPGGELAKTAVTFLKEVNLGQTEDIGDKVVIVGGGGVAFDCAFTSNRLGASEVHVICVESAGNMCASQDDIRQAQEEGVIIHNSRMISRVLNDNGKASGIEYYEISSFEFDENGSLSVQPVSGETKNLKADTVIAAVGEQPGLEFIEGHKGLKMTARGNLDVDPGTLETTVEGVFAAGDAVSGPSTVVQAIGSGRKAAIIIDNYLLGKRSEGIGRISINEDGHVVKEESYGEVSPHVVEFEEILNIDYHEKRQRQVTQKLPKERSARSFDEIERGLGKKEAGIEAERCFHCGHCTSCGCCVENCPGLILDMSSQGPQVEYFDECWHCGCCRIACPSGAVYYEFPLNMMV